MNAIVITCLLWLAAMPTALFAMAGGPANRIYATTSSFYIEDTLGNESGTFRDGLAGGGAGFEYLRGNWFYGALEGILCTGRPSAMVFNQSGTLQLREQLVNDYHLEARGGFTVTVFNRLLAAVFLGIGYSYYSQETEVPASSGCLSTGTCGCVTLKWRYYYLPIGCLLDWAALPRLNIGLRAILQVQLQPTITCTTFMAGYWKLNQRLPVIVEAPFTLLVARQREGYWLLGVVPFYYRQPYGRTVQDSFFVPEGKRSRVGARVEFSFAFGHPGSLRR
jgi:hypothetical protein